MTNLTTTFHSLTSDSAIQLCMAAIEHAKSQNIAISICVVDTAGAPLAAVRMNQSPLISPEVARKKAFTAVSFGKPSKHWQTALADRNNNLLALQSEPNFTLLGGGIPIFIDDNIVAAIGVSGGSEAQDIDCATHAIESIIGTRSANID